MQTLGEGDGFFPLPGMRGPDAGERFRASPEVKYEHLVQQLRKVFGVLEFPKLLIFFKRTRGRKKDISGPLVWRFMSFFTWVEAITLRRSLIIVDFSYISN